MVTGPASGNASIRKIALRRSASLTLFLLIAATLAITQQQQPTASIGAARAEIAPPRPNYPFPDGKGYVYSAEWHLITAGTATVKMEVSGSERKVSAVAESTGAVNVIFPVHDHFE